MRMIGVMFFLILVQTVAALADGHDAHVGERLNRETWIKETRLVPFSSGVTRKGTSIPCWIDKAELVDEPERRHVWLVGGLDGSEVGVQTTMAMARWFHTAAETSELRKQCSLSAVVIGNPDGWASQLGEKNESEGVPVRAFPPLPDAYVDSKNPEAQYLWRWLGSQAPDLVVEVRANLAGDSVKWLHAPDVIDQSSLTAQLSRVATANMGTIPANQLSVSSSSSTNNAISLLSDALKGPIARSEARKERLQRLDRSPLEVATQLSRRYGHSLKNVQYIPAVAVIGRQRLSELTGDASHRAGIDELIAPYRSGERRAIGDKPSGSDFSGQLIFGELALKSRDDKLIALIKTAADFGFNDNGQPRESMPAHVEMSDAVFMSCPLLAQAGKLTGDVKYYDQCARHLTFMRKLCARSDGLYRNSPLNDAAWGRGNGFPALGLAWALEYLPTDHPKRAEVLAVFQEHLNALSKHQDLTGMWHQVIDHPESYRELTATCMITFAMLRGIEHGWLDRTKFEPHIRAAWPALKVRIAADGSLIDVCEGTGKQTSLRGYLDRKAILGPDDRGGAMALLVSVEMASFEKRKSP